MDNADALSGIVSIIKELGVAGISLVIIKLLYDAWKQEREYSHQIRQQHVADLRNAAKLPGQTDIAGD